MHRFQLTPTVTLVLSQGDITATRADAIVNAANQTLMGGGGVNLRVWRRAARQRLREL